MLRLISCPAMSVSGSQKARGLLGLWADAAGRTGDAEALATALGLTLMADGPDELASLRETDGLLLVLADGRLELRSTRRGGPGAVRAEFVDGSAGRRLRAARGGGELLARAVGLTSGGSAAAGTRMTSVLDATAGLGFDSALMAVLGADVVAVERHPVVAALLADGLRRAQASPDVAARLGGRLRLFFGDARTRLVELAQASALSRPDVVFIDPMFPAGRGSAASRKQMQMFRDLLGDDLDAAELLPMARACATRRVVVKRPRHAPQLAGQAPDVTYAGSSTRFDAYLRHDRPRPAADHAAPDQPVR